MANPPFNVDKVNAESTQSAGRLPFGMPSVNAKKEVGNGNYLWISYFHSYLNEHGRAGFVMASSATDSSGKDRNIRQKLVETGHVDVMVSVGNNFFYTKSLPCSLWFFDKGKREELQNKVLFIDARNYYTVVDRTLNEWSDWQLKNLNAIVWLYRGEPEKYRKLLKEYYAEISALLDELDDICRDIPVYTDDIYADMIQHVQAFSAKVTSIKVLSDCFDAKEYLNRIYDSWRRTTEQIFDDVALFERINQYFTAKKRGYKNIKDYKKSVIAEQDAARNKLSRILTVIDDAQWLYEKFGEGEYRDIPGLCKVVSRTEIAEKNYSLTPGAYVGVAAAEDDGVDFALRMAEIHQELLALQAESNELMQTISENMKEMGL